MAPKRFFVGFDVGGTTRRVGITTDSGEPLHPEPLVTPSSVFEDTKKWLRSAASDLEKVIEETGVTRKHIGAIGLATAGPADREGLIGRSTNFGSGWHNFPVRARLEDILQIPVYYENDANAALLGEAAAWQELSPHCNVAMFTTGTGLGGALMVDGVLVRGHRGMGMEVGHAMMVAPETLAAALLPECGCGRVGCLEAYTSLHGLAWQLDAALKLPEYADHPLQNEDVPLYERACGLRALAGEGDQLAEMLILKQAEYLGLCCWQVTAMADPQIIIIGGGMNDATENLKTRYLENVRDTFDRKAFAAQQSSSADGVRISWARLGDDAGWRGAAYSAAQRLIFNR